MDAGVDMSDDQQDIARGRDMVDSLFQGAGGMGGTHNAIMSSADYLSTAQRSLGNIEDGFYIAPAFLDKLSIHVAKVRRWPRWAPSGACSHAAAAAASPCLTLPASPSPPPRHPQNFLDLPKIKVPLILGIWGGKGQGKTFQCNLAYKKLGIAPIVMSAGELESGNAGEPAKLIRQRYREASDLIKKGRMSSLFINDLDAGAGRMGDATQYTVNNQVGAGAGAGGWRAGLATSARLAGRAPGFKRWRPACLSLFPCPAADPPPGLPQTHAHCRWSTPRS